MKTKQPKGEIVTPCKSHVWARTAVFYSSEEQTCLNCGKKREHRKEPLEITQ